MDSHGEPIRGGSDLGLVNSVNEWLSLLQCRSHGQAPAEPGSSDLANLSNRADIGGAAARSGLTYVSVMRGESPERSDHNALSDLLVERAAGAEL